jgi:hypothetical protein
MAMIPFCSKGTRAFSVMIALFFLSSCLPARQPEDWSATKAGEDDPFKNTPISSPRERFDRFLDPVDKVVKAAKREKDIQTRISMLYQAIEPLRYLQVLIYIYEKRFPEIEKYYEDAKTLENHIGHQGDLQDFYQKALEGGNPANIVKHKKLLEEGQAALNDYVTNSKWFASGTDLVDEMKSVLKRIKWDSIEDDRNMVLSRIAKKMKKQHENEYDLTHPEDGMHEFRRDLRRFRYLNLVTGNFVVDDREGACPLGGAVVPEPKPGPTDDYFCHVNSCVTDKLESTSAEMVPLKYEGNLQLARDGKVDPKIIAKAKAVYADFMKSKAYLFLTSDLLSCRTKKETAADKAEDREDK